MNKNETIVTELHKQGLSDTKISAQTGIHRQIIGKIRRRLKLPVNSRFLDKEEEIKKLVNNNYNDKEISDILNISDKTICYIRKRMGLKTKFPIKKYFNSIDKKKGYWLRNIRNSALARNLDYNLTIDDFELPEYCPILEIKLDYKGIPNNPFNASIDRIDNSKGYIKGNVIVISRKANQMKNSGSLEELLVFSSNIKKLINYYKDQGALGSITDVFPNTKFCKEI